MKETIVEALRQPEYTGENRCLPCTVVNLVIAGILGALVARRSRLAGVLAVGLSAIVIYLRGYLVPGTPELTKRYLPPSVLRLFGKDPEPTVHSGLGTADSPDRDSHTHDSSGDDAGSVAPSAPDADDGRTGDDSIDAAEEADEEPLSMSPESYFLELDVVEPCEEIDDLCLTEAFESAWSDEIDRIDADRLDGTDAAASLGFEDEDEEFEIEEHDDARALQRGKQHVGRWPSQAALVADVTAARVLESWDDDWESYRPVDRGELLNSLRLFLETCPTSGGEVVMGEETVESCCQSHDVIAVTCSETGERLFEHPVAEIEP